MPLQKKLRQMKLASNLLLNNERKLDWLKKNVRPMKLVLPNKERQLKINARSMKPNRRKQRD